MYPCHARDRSVLRAWRGTALAVGLVLGAAGCGDLSGTGQLPAGTSDPKRLQNAAGALAMYQGAIDKFAFASLTPNGTTESTVPRATNGAFVELLLAVGLLTDELQPATLGGSPAAYGTRDAQLIGLMGLDARRLPESPTIISGDETAYSQLQAVRSAASQGIGALRRYVPADSARTGHLLALAGYAELLLADLYCSGVPLSTLDYESDFTYSAGSTTAQVYQHAVALFDTAVTLSTDSARFLNLARVGKGRALLDLGAYDQAALAVAAVPDTFQYRFLVNWPSATDPNSTDPLLIVAGASVTDSTTNGSAGLLSRSWNDPRTAVVEAGINQFGKMRYVPAKYSAAAPGPVTVASGIEARLIEAEAALHAGGDWLGILNRLRRQANDPQLPDTLHDPVTPAARVDLLFHERAAWLFVTGQRQGDLRRLVRAVSQGGYGRPQAQVYPTGTYPAPSVFPQYGSDVTLPIPSAERLNPKFTGCLDRRA